VVPRDNTDPAIMERVPYSCICEPHAPFRIRYVPDVSTTDTVQKGMVRHKNARGPFIWLMVLLRPSSVNKQRGPQRLVKAVGHNQKIYLIPEHLPSTSLHTRSHGCTQGSRAASTTPTVDLDTQGWFADWSEYAAGLARKAFLT
jgi:hypothetical protein